MSADEDILLLGAYHDGELSPGEALSMDKKLASDPALRDLAGRLKRLSRAAHSALPLPPPSPELRTRIAQRFGSTPIGALRPRSRNLSSWQSIAAALLIGVIGGGVLGSAATYISVSPSSDAIVDTLVADHLRGLMAPQAFDIASSDRHVVKPWFNGKTTVAPDAPDLAGKGFPLAGGRVDIVAGKPVPTLVYRSDKHVISVFVLPRAAGAPSGEEEHAGSKIFWWSVGDLTYWAVSDVNRKALSDFATLYRDAVGRG